MKALVYDQNLTFHIAIQELDKVGRGVLPVIDIGGKLVGIITDGDVRRAVLANNLTLDSVINKNPICKNEEIEYQEAIKFLKKIKQRHLPIVNSNFEYVKMISLDDRDFFQESTPVVIMAGGLGSRLGELTKEVPKPMLRVGDKPIMHNIIESFIDAGFSNFYICVNYKAEVIKKYFNDGKEFGVTITYVEEDRRLGTAGALAYLKNKIADSFFVINGDVLATLNLNELLSFHKRQKATVTMCTRQVKIKVPFGVVEVENNKVIMLKEKPLNAYSVNAGIYVLEPVALENLELGEYLDMTTLLNDLLDKEHRISAFELEDSWVDVGHVEDYMRVDKAFSKRNQLSENCEE